MIWTMQCRITSLGEDNPSKDDWVLNAIAHRFGIPALKNSKKICCCFSMGFGVT
jgi:hypothetical protein